VDATLVATAVLALRIAGLVRAIISVDAARSRVAVERTLGVTGLRSRVGALVGIALRLSSTGARLRLWRFRSFLRASRRAARRTAGLVARALAVAARLVGALARFLSRRANFALAWFSRRRSCRAAATALTTDAIALFALAGAAARMRTT